MEQPIKMVHENGTQVWRLDGKYHRVGGPARIWADGAQSWYQHGKRHRIDGPAYIGVDGTKAWNLHGERHRIDGPAYIWSDGTKEYWLNGTELTEGSIALKLVKERERRRETQDGTTD